MSLPERTVGGVTRVGHGAGAVERAGADIRAGAGTATGMDIPAAAATATGMDKRAGAVVTSRAAALDAILAALAEAPRMPVVLIDGPSGSGKSTLADDIRAAWPGQARRGQAGPGQARRGQVRQGQALPQLVRLDDIYPGWDGLEAASRHLTERVLRPRAEGRPAAWQRWDWLADAPAEWHSVDPTRPLIVEGCGTLSRANLPLSDVRVWLQAEDGVRKRRAIARDGATFSEHWSQWQAQWEAFCVRETPTHWADIVIFSGDDDGGED